VGDLFPDPVRAFGLVLDAVGDPVEVLGDRERRAEAREDVDHAVAGVCVLFEEAFDEHMGCAEVLALVGELVAV